MITTVYDPTSSAHELATVLIVEDEAVMRLLLQEFLEDHGFKILEAANADEAVGIIEKAGLDIDLVFTDIRMPGEMDGIGLAQWVRQQLPLIPVIVASGHVANANVAKAAGELFCEKPYQLEQVAAKIRAAIEARKFETTQ